MLFLALFNLSAVRLRNCKAAKSAIPIVTAVEAGDVAQRHAGRRNHVVPPLRMQYLCHDPPRKTQITSLPDAPRHSGARRSPNATAPVSKTFRCAAADPSADSVYDLISMNRMQGAAATVGHALEVQGQDA